MSQLFNAPLRRFAPFLTAMVLAAIATSSEYTRQGLKETALDRYVAKPDPSFAWKMITSVRDDSATGYALQMTSQNWLTTNEVNRTEWKHFVLVVKPDNLAHDTALLFISGGNNQKPKIPTPPKELIEIAKATKSVVVELKMVPNQPLIFGNDGKEREEDDLIAYTWDKFLRTGDEKWPARLPMTKSAVRAMDAVTEFLASSEGGKASIKHFTVAGGSKRGWTTWATAIVDKRVVAICPIVIDVLNTEASMTHHFQAYGFFAPAVGNYTEQKIMDWIGTPESKALYSIEDPFSYRDRLTMPKLLLNACGDQFFLPDSSQFYFSKLPGVKYLRYVPNVDHSLKNSDAYETLLAWQYAVVNSKPLPLFAWKHSKSGTTAVTCKTQPKEVRLWQATNPNARDFRLETLGAVWTSEVVSAADGAYQVGVKKPKQGWTAYMVELTFDVGAKTPLKLTTDVSVLPNKLPFKAPHPEKPKGFLAK
jgi:PhoPQ-activated pathogenicity-related protein